MCTINDHLEFGKNFKDTYPSELELKKENIPTSEASLELSTDIENNTCKTKFYEKREAFPLLVIQIPHLDSNIPLNIYYASIGSEILKFARTASDSKTFATLSNRLLKRMQKIG